MAPSSSIDILDELFADERDFDMTASRIATGMYWLGDLIPEIATAYEDCDELKEDIESLNKIYDNHFKDALAGIETFSDIYGVISGLKDEITPYTTELGNGKNAAMIAKVVNEYYPLKDGRIME